MKYFLFFYVVLMIIAGCTASKKEGEIVQLDIEKFKNAANEVTLDGVKYSLDAYLWRDSMPVTDSVKSKGLMASIKIKISNSSPASSDLTVSNIWIMNKTEIWTPDLHRLRQINDNEYEIYVSGGPLWEGGTYAGVYAEFQMNNHKLFLGTKNQKINIVY